MAVQLDPEVKIIWAHAGLGEPAEVVYSLMVGSDTWVNGQWENYSSIMDTNRAWLAKLPEDVARKIAYQNAERLFGRKISMELIGKCVRN